MRDGRREMNGDSRFTDYDRSGNLGYSSNHGALYSDGSDDSELEVWDEFAVAAVETKMRRKHREHGTTNSVKQWGNAYFRPGTAPEVERNLVTPAYNDASPKKAALSSPPTSLSEINFALRAAAKQAQKHKSSSRPPSGARGTPDATARARASEKKERNVARSSGGAHNTSQSRSRGDSLHSNNGLIPSSASTPTEIVERSRPGVDPVSEHDDDLISGSPAIAENNRGSSGLPPRTPVTPSSRGTPEGAARKTIRSASRKSDGSRQERKTLNSASNNSPHGRPPPKPESPGQKATTPSKQRKAASARLSRQPELPIHALYSQVYLEEGAPVPQSHPQMFFQKRTRPPSRHRSPQDSLGLDVQPQPIPRMRSAHYPSHHERPPSRCKPPPEALHLEDAASDEESEHCVARPSSSRSRRGPTPRPDASPMQPTKRPSSTSLPKRPVSGTPSRTACDGEFDRPAPQAGAPAPQTPEPANGNFPDEDEGTSSEEECVGIGKSRSASAIGTSSGRPPISPGMRPGPARKAPVATVPFRTSLSPDFLRLFAPSGSAAPPTPPTPPTFTSGPAAPTTQMVFSNHINPKDNRDEIFSECMSMGLTDIPSPTDDLFGPFSDKDLFSKKFGLEDIGCLSDDNC